MSRGEFASPARTSPSSSRTDAVTFDEATMPGAKPAAPREGSRISPGKGAVTLGKAAALPRAAAFSPDKAAALRRGAAFPDEKAAALGRAAAFSLGKGTVTLEKAAALPRGAAFPDEKAAALPEGAAFPDGKAAALPRGAGFGLGKAAALGRAAAFSRITGTFPRVTGALPRETAAALARGAGVALVGAASPPRRRCSRSFASSSPCVAVAPPPRAPRSDARRTPSRLRHEPPARLRRTTSLREVAGKKLSALVVRQHDSAQPVPGRLVAEGDEGVRSLGIRHILQRFLRPIAPHPPGPDGR